MTATKTKARTGTTSTGRTKRDLYQEITDRVVAALEAGTAPWRKPWSYDGTPRNLDGKAYRGVNPLLLMLSAQEGGFTSPFWMTFKQAKDRGGKVKKGEHGTMIVFWRRITVADTDESGKPEIKSIPMLRHYYVFNVEQTEDVRLPEKVANWLPSREHQPHEAAEAVLTSYVKPPRVSETGSSAYYSPAKDEIVVPPRDAFDTLDEFYATLFHELGHSTGHKDRLARKYGDTFGSHEYGREELVAEMTATFLASETGVETTFDNSAAYLGSWISTIKEDPRAVVTAAGQAQRAVDLILGRTWDDE